MALVIRPEHRANFGRLLDEMFRLRRRVFVERLDWRMPTDNGVHEIDEFDHGGCLHLVSLNEQGRVVGSSRLTSTTEPNVTCNVLAGQIGVAVPRDKRIVEVSRLCVDHSDPEVVRKEALKDLRLSQFELYRKHGWEQVLTVAYARSIQPWIRAGGKVEIIGSPTVFPGDKEPSFAVLMSGTPEGDTVVERHVGKVGGNLQDPRDEPTLIAHFGNAHAA